MIAFGKLLLLIAAWIVGFFLLIPILRGMLRFGRRQSRGVDEEDRKNVYSK